MHKLIATGERYIFLGDDRYELIDRFITYYKLHWIYDTDKCLLCEMTIIRTT